MSLGTCPCPSTLKGPLGLPLPPEGRVQLRKVPEHERDIVKKALIEAKRISPPIGQQLLRPRKQIVVPSDGQKKETESLFPGKGIKDSRPLPPPSDLTPTSQPAPVTPKRISPATSLEPTKQFPSPRTPDSPSKPPSPRPYSTVSPKFTQPVSPLTSSATNFLYTSPISPTSVPHSPAPVSPPCSPCPSAPVSPPCSQCAPTPCTPPYCPSPPGPAFPRTSPYLPPRTPTTPQPLPSLDFATPKRPILSTPAPPIHPTLKPLPSIPEFPTTPSPRTPPPMPPKLRIPRGELPPPIPPKRYRKPAQKLPPRFPTPYVPFQKDSETEPLLSPKIPIPQEPPQKASETQVDIPPRPRRARPTTGVAQLYTQVDRERIQWHDTEHDPFFSAKTIHSLNSQNYDDFLKTTDVALVMYYSPKEWESTWSGIQFSAASTSSTKSNRLFAAVDCSAESSICEKENIQERTPVFKLFSNNTEVAKVTDYQSFTAYRMMKYIHLSPKMDKPVKAKCKKIKCNKDYLILYNLV